MKHRINSHLLIRILFCLGIVGAATADPSDTAVPSSLVVDRIRVYKKARTLEVLSGGRVVHAFRIALGRNPVGHKTREGDGKTPEGHYVLDYRKADSTFYKALHVSYPNTQDIAQARANHASPGGQIMIHGQRNGFGWLWPITQRFDWTNGCIALSNDDMEVLWSLVKEGTPLEVLP